MSGGDGHVPVQVLHKLVPPRPAVLGLPREVVAEVRGDGMPERIRLSRAKGWRMPPDTVKVDRTGPWGNPFVVGRDGTRAECVDLYIKLMAGYVALGKTATVSDQKAARQHVVENLGAIRGKNLACWCSHDGPCHGDVLLNLANG
jgi:hypothetical protein